MNITEVEKLEKRPSVMDRVTRAAFYAYHQGRTPGFAAVWSEVDHAERAIFHKVATAVLGALIDDYTTPGCNCRYCTWTGKTNHGRPIMCRQRWEKIPLADRAVILESCAD